MTLQEQETFGARDHVVYEDVSDPLYSFKGDYDLDKFILIALGILESEGYTGLLELMAVLEDPKLILKIVALFSGSSIEIPKASHFAKCLRTALFVFRQFNGRLTPNGYMKEQMSEKEYEDIVQIRNKFLSYLKDNGVGNINKLLRNGFSTRDLVDKYDK